MLLIKRSLKKGRNKVVIAGGLIELRAIKAGRLASLRIEAPDHVKVKQVGGDYIFDDIVKVRVMGSDRSSINLGVDAPRDIDVFREECLA